MPNACKYLLLDIGGSWIKGIAVDADAYESARKNRAQFLALFENTRRVPSESDDSTGHRFLAALKTLSEMWGPVSSYKSVAISTAGVVGRCGARIGKCNNHLAFSPDASWPKDFQAFLGCPVTFINDGEAFMLGAAELGYVPRMGTVCALIVGTGLGCAVVKDRRWWRPHRRDPLLGSIWVPGGNYDSVVNASKLAEYDVNGDLVRCLSEPEYKAVRENYWSDLAQIAVTSALLHGADKVLLGGGLCGAASAGKVDVQKEVSKYFTKLPSELDRWPELKVVAEGNLAQLIGTAALAHGHVKHSISSSLQKAKAPTVSPRENVQGNFERMDVSRKSVETDVPLSQEALTIIEQAALHIAQRWPSGGRIIVAGAGNEGRVAASAAIEIVNAFGESRDRVVAILAGGMSEAALNSEGDEEKNFSSVPDMILLNPGPDDTVIGVSANSFFAHSALAYAEQQGAATLMLQGDDSESAHAWNWTIPLSSAGAISAGIPVQKIFYCLAEAILFQMQVVRQPGY